MSHGEGPAWRRAPDPPVVSPGRVHLWRFDLDADTRPDAAFLAQCSHDERARASRLVQPLARRRFLVRRAALRTTIGRYLGVPPADISLSSGPFGKPALAGSHEHSDLRFNASDSDGLALVAITRLSDIGVDIERLRPVRGVAAIARRVFTADDAHDIMTLEAPDARLRAFFRAWCRQEAFAKALGVGLGAEPSKTGPDGEARAWSIVPVDVGAGFDAVLAVASRPVRVACFDDRGLDAARD